MLVPAPDLLALGVEVARQRRAHGYSIDALAEAAGVHRKTIIQIEAGRVAARVSTLHGIAHALDAPLAELLEPLCRQHAAPQRSAAR
ncbi:hypothetical protein ACIFOC_00862 [Leucobacter aridicollis]|uniref:helix-turn-helix domain-containing protein n=1 Tax=Leucobacter aridicollis TaxID=283878 RepID=UPI0037C623F6